MERASIGRRGGHLITRGRVGPLQRLPILPRSLHLPNGSTDGRLTEKLNKIGVRLWTGCSRAIAPTVVTDGVTRLASQRSPRSANARAPALSPWCSMR